MIWLWVLLGMLVCIALYRHWRYSVRLPQELPYDHPLRFGAPKRKRIRVGGLPEAIDVPLRKVWM